MILKLKDQEVSSSIQIVLAWQPWLTFALGNQSVVKVSMSVWRTGEMEYCGLLFRDP
jgi:hypothetical protein